MKHLEPLAQRRAPSRWAASNREVVLAATLAVAVASTALSLSLTACGAGNDTLPPAAPANATLTGVAADDSYTGAVMVTWNANVATSGVSLSFIAGGEASNLNVNGNFNPGACKAAAAGTWSMLIDTGGVGVGVGVAMPQICVDGLPEAPASQADFCGGADYASQLPPDTSVVSCTFANNIGTYNVRIGPPLALHYTVKYTFVKR